MKQRFLQIAALGILGLTGSLATAGSSDYDDDDHDYLIERNESGAVEGTPDNRLIIGRRQIDGYTQSDGSVIWFEGNSIVRIDPPPHR